VFAGIHLHDRDNHIEIDIDLLGSDDGVGDFDSRGGISGFCGLVARMRLELGCIGMKNNVRKVGPGGSLDLLHVLSLPFPRFRLIKIQDTGKGKKPVADDLEAVLRKIEYWRQASICRYRISYLSPQETEHTVEWDGRRCEFLSNAQGLANG